MKKQKIEDPRLTSEVRRKSFLVSEKDYLFNELIQRHENNKKINVANENLYHFICDLIRDYIYTPELCNLLGKVSPRLYSKLEQISISFEDIELCSDEYYFYTMKDKDGNKIGSVKVDNMISLTVSSFLKEGEKNYLILLKETAELGKSLYKKCPPEKITALKNMITEIMELKGELKAYLWDWKNHKYRWTGPRAFESISSWGALYKINKNWFDIVFDRFNYNLSKKDDKLLTSESKLKDLEEFLNI